MSKPAFSQPLPLGEYKRTFSAEIDCLSARDLCVTGAMNDESSGLRHTWTLRTPEYEILEASAFQNEGSLDRDLCDRYSGIAGVRIGRGFSKRVLGVLGEGHGQREHLLLAIEMARVGQQVYQFPPELEAQFAAARNPQAGESEPARVAWLKDRAYMQDLANSCYTYRDETAELFHSRDVKCGFAGNITRPRPGDKRVFWRQKEIEISRDADGSFHCRSAMEDSIHDISIEFDISKDGIIQSASSTGRRLPYHGICEDAQLRTSGLEGLEITNDFVRQFADVVGGRRGCTHLFDLSIDCLRLFDFQ
jgi:hypothetical protein